MNAHDRTALRRFLAITSLDQLTPQLVQEVQTAHRSLLAEQEAKDDALAPNGRPRRAESV